MIDQPDAWSSPLSKWHKGLINDTFSRKKVTKIKVENSVTLIGPNGNEIEVAESKVVSYLAIGLSLRSENE